MNAAEIREKFKEVMADMEQLTVRVAAIIPDYPIGGSSRGQCKLSVDYEPKKGVRSVKQTTNKHGRWCAPKKSVYRGGGMYVVEGPMVENRYEWLNITNDGIYFQAANGDHRWYLKTPLSGHVTTVRRVWTIGGEERVFEPDPLDVVDAWEAWMDGIITLDKMMKQKMKAARADEAALTEAITGEAV